MCKSDGLRALVQERLTAAADEIFALFERTIAEFEEELRRSKEENQKKQELLEAVLNPRVVLLREIQPTSSGAGLNQDLEIKEEPEEPRVKEEEEQRPVPECPAPVCVKTEESSLLQQRQTELKEETQGEDFSTETHIHLKTESESSDTDNDDDWEHSAVQKLLETTTAKPVSEVKAQQNKTLVCPSPTSLWTQQTLETCWKQLKELKATFTPERNHSAVQPLLQLFLSNLRCPGGFRLWFRLGGVLCCRGYCSGLDLVVIISCSL
ncbi:hypothetical protein WMY93_010061 [Mugilogobius chulae]|uniref:Uncharacterized protein n=1 Tax=Mugilogobius chulae TaxID=88201 RepID=A0AAW0PA10_9GOBI